MTEKSAEGEIWEVALFAAHYNLDNLIAFLDWNKLQIDGTNDEVMSLGDPAKKYYSFGWNSKLVNGHNVLEIQSAVKFAVEEPNGKPTVIILDTIKGCGAKCIVDMKAANHCIGFNDTLRVKVLEELELEAKRLGVEDK